MEDNKKAPMTLTILKHLEETINLQEQEGAANTIPEPVEPMTMEQMLHAKKVMRAEISMTPYIKVILVHPNNIDEIIKGPKPIKEEEGKAFFASLWGSRVDMSHHIEEGFCTVVFSDGSVRTWDLINGGWVDVQVL